jgi:hypothetical protein
MTKVEFFFNGECGKSATGESLYGFRLRGKKGKSFKFSASQLGDYKPEPNDGVSIAVAGEVKQTADRKLPDGSVKFGWVDCTNAKVMVVDYKRNAYVPAAQTVDIAAALAGGDDIEAPFTVEG